MLRFALSIGAVSLLASCSVASQPTRVVNRSARPLTVTYADIRDGVPRTVEIGAGQTATLSPITAFAQLGNLRLDADGKGFVWNDWPSKRARMKCSADCSIVWHEGHRATLSGPFAAS